GAGRDAYLVKARERTDQAEAIDPNLVHSLLLWYQRAKVAELQNQVDEEQRLRSRAGEPQTARDFYWKGSTLWTHGGPKEALPLLRKAVELEPGNFWAWFNLGNCYDLLGQNARAESCYDTCIALQPEMALAHLNRGLALLRQQEFPRAIDAFDAA